MRIVIAIVLAALLLTTGCKAWLSNLVDSVTAHPDGQGEQ
jgi:hypothetical protein